MDPVERLASYLADELDPDEHAAVEAALARDPGLRSQLADLRHADEALERLPGPTPPPGFDARLDARLDRELTELLGPAPRSETVAASAGATAADRIAADEATRRDELAARRDRRPLPRWVAVTSAAAAAVVVLAGGGVLLRGVVVSPDDDAALDAPALLESDDVAPLDVPAEQAEDALPSPGDGPVVVARDRDLDEEGLTALLEDRVAFALAEHVLAPAAALRLRTPYLDVYQVHDLERPAEEERRAEDTDAPVEAEDGEPVPLRAEGPVTEDDLDAVARCLTVIMAGSPDAIPVYAELAAYEGQAVVLAGLVTEDPATGAFTRRELWVLSRDGCEIQLITQR